MDNFISKYGPWVVVTGASSEMMNNAFIFMGTRFKSREGVGFDVWKHEWKGL